MNYFREEIRKIMISVNMIDGIYTMSANKAGMKYNTFALLYALDDGQPHSQKDICEHWLIPKTTINTIVKECINAGYVVLDTLSRTKEKNIRLTDKGREFARPVLNQFYEAERRAMEQTLVGCSPEFVQALEAFTFFLKKETEQLPWGNE